MKKVKCEKCGYKDVAQEMVGGHEMQQEVIDAIDLSYWDYWCLECYLTKRDEIEKATI